MTPRRNNDNPEERLQKAVVQFVVPGEPQGKGRARFGNGRTYTPAKTVFYEGLIAFAAQTAMAGRPLMDGPLRVSLWADLSVPKSAPRKLRELMLADKVHPTKKPDFDNILKAIGDACNKVVFHDDTQITRLGESGKRYGAVPGLTVVIEQIDFTL